MSINDILISIENEIQSLQQARALLSSLDGRRVSKPPIARRYRKRRTLSPEARKKIADAQKKRWAKQRETKKN
jgi:hypothetical protein